MMTTTKAQKSGSWTPQIQKKAPSLAPPPIVVQRDAVAAPTSEAPLPEYTPLEPNALQNHPLMGNISDLPPIQTKLTIGAPGDKYEQEADTIARKVVSQINSPTAQAKPTTKVLQRQPIGRDITVSPFAGMMQAKEAIAGGPASQDLESSINRAKGGGQPLDAGLQQSMGQAMGADFSGVRVHTDSSANNLSQSIQAKAFTTGQDVFFAQGQYDPGSKDGQELIAHELTHTIQQSSASTIQRKTKNIPQLSSIDTRALISTKAEDLQGLIIKYNQIKQDDKNFDLQKEILSKIKEIATAWLESDADSAKKTKKPEVIDTRTRAEEELAEVARQKEEKVADVTQDDRGTLGKTGVSNALIDPIYDSELYAEIYGAVLSKLGVGRGAWRRSDELNQFRQKLKDAARTQAATDIEQSINHQSLSGDARKEYIKMKANVEAYGLAKGSVDQVMKQQAEKIVDNVIPKVSTVLDLRKAANERAIDKTRSLISKDPELQNQDNIKAIKKAAIEAATQQAKSILSQKEPAAVAIAREITKGDPLRQEEQALTEKVIDQTKTDRVGSRAIQKVIEADTLTQGFEKIASLIDANASAAGTSVSLNIELRIKDPMTGGYFISQFIGEASKEQEEETEPLEVSLRSEFSLGGGWERFGLDLNAQVGFFFESTATDTKKAVGLISYGLYRTLQTKNLDSTVANAIWGYGGKSQLKHKGKEAETWATAMEEYLFKNAQGNIDETSKVEVGALLKGNAKANLGFATGELEAKFSYAKQYSAESIGGTTAVGKSKDQTQLNQAFAAKNVTYIEVNGKMEALEEFAGGQAGVKFGLDGTTFKSVEIEAAGFLSSALAKGGKDYGTVMNHVCKAIAGYVTSLAAIGKKAYNVAKNKARTTAEKGGEITGIFSDLGMMAVTIGDEVGAEWGSKIVNVAGEEVGQDIIKITATEAAMNPLLDIKQQLKIGGGLSWESGEGFKVNVYVSQVKGIAVDTGALLGEVFRLKIKGEATNKIVSKTF
ncbi:DUF4157 domain-containing protein [Planktothricoides sp. SR001]|uniref:eCIS core domain-containing protein n=1 Tax=Planktothricoides sp. SR001 TaxID=1705388 RepID=UPI0018D05AAC|nr:DUF4157 domain-containing protein [Planktothricoides sp. SR001]